MCEILGVGKSAYSYWKNHGRTKEEEKIFLCQQIVNVYAESNGIYGAPKISQVLKQHGVIASTSKVSRLMRLLGIRSIVSERFKPKKSTLSNEEKKLIVNLIKNLKVNRINQVWTTDITYIKTTREGTFFLITFIDYYSKKVVSWGLTARQTADEIIAVLKRAIVLRNPLPGLIIHSDKGSQFRANKYRKLLSRKNFLFSYTSLNHSCDENAAQESFHSLIKKECIYLHCPKTFNEAYSLISFYIDNYNSKRIHSSINYLSPHQFELSLSIPPFLSSNY